MNRLFIALFMSCAVATARAQSPEVSPGADTDISGFEFGLRISPQLSWLAPDSKNLLANGSSLDWSWGFSVTRKLSERYGIATEVNVVYMSSKARFDEPLKLETNTKGTLNNVTDLAYNYNLRYLQVPVLFRMNTAEVRENLRFYGEFGLGFGFLIRSKADVSSALNGFSVSDMDVETPDAKDAFKIRDTASTSSKIYSDDINFFRPSYIIGGGVMYNLFGQTKAYAGLRYDGGLRDILSDEHWLGNNSFAALNIGIIF